MAETLTVNLTITASPAAPRTPLVIPKDVSPSSLRKLVSEATKIPVDKLRLIFRGRLIGDDESKKAVEEFKLEEGTVLHCMGKPEGNAAAAAPAASAPAVTAAAATTAGATVSTPQPTSVAASTASSSNPLQAAFANLRSSNPPQTYMTAVTTLEKILSNIVTNPMEEKYRRVKKNNAAFQKRLGGVAGGDNTMKAVGFLTETDNGEEVYLMHASAEKWPQLMAAKASVEAAVREAKAAANQASAPPAGGMPSFGGMPGMGAGMPGMGAGMPGMAGMPGGPDMQNAAARMMSDPNMLSSMLQNPMVQNMIRNDPRFANNPAMRQSMEQLANNPAMVQQIAQMMQDPNAQQQMQQMQTMMQDPNMQQQMQAMMGAAGSGGMPPGGFGGMGMPPFGANPGTANNNAGAGQQGGANAGANDQDQTEEEMIAEAIRRSLEEGGA